MRIYLQNLPAPDQRPRFYHLILQPDLLGGWSLIRESGYQGAPGRVQRQHYETLEDAESAMIKCRDSQLKRGYRVVFMQGQERPQ